MEVYSHIQYIQKGYCHMYVCITITSIGNGAWETRGVDTTITMDRGDGSFDIRCTSTHFTNFAVLVDVLSADEVCEHNSWTNRECMHAHNYSENILPHIT